MIHKALGLSKDHLQLFSPNSPSHETGAGQAVEALDGLVQELAASVHEQVHIAYLPELFHLVGPH